MYIQIRMHTFLLELENDINLKLSLSNLRYIQLLNFLDVPSALL